MRRIHLIAWVFFLASGLGRADVSLPKLPVVGGVSSLPALPPPEALHFNDSLSERPSLIGQGASQPSPFFSPLEAKTFLKDSQPSEGNEPATQTPNSSPLSSPGFSHSQFH